MSSDFNLSYLKNPFGMVSLSSLFRKKCKKLEYLYCRIMNILKFIRRFSTTYPHAKFAQSSYNFLMEYIEPRISFTNRKPE